MSDFRSYTAQTDTYRLKIQEDLPEVGWYLPVYNHDGQCVYDYLQDSLPVTMAFAKERFGVAPESWIENKENI